MSTIINADDGIVSGVAGLKYSADNSGNLVLQTNGTNAISISSAQVVTFTNAVSFTSGSFTSITDSGNLTFTGTGNRITGDFSNATLANRVAFQTSTTNGNTAVWTLPNGTGNSSNLAAFNNSDPTNASNIQIRVGNSTADILAGITGTGTYLPLTMYTGGSERLRIDTSGNVGIGVTPTTGSQLSTIQTPYGIFGGNNQININNNAYYSSGWKYIGTGTATLYAQNISGATGGHTFSTAVSGTAGNAITWLELMRIDSSGNVGIGTSSPKAGLDVTVASGQNLALTKSGGAYLSFYEGSTLRATINGLNTADGLVFTTGSGFTERMRIDSSGNVGIGITPSSWNTFAVIESGLAGNSFFGQSGAAQVGVGFNSYYNSGWKYANGGQPATLYYQLSGVHTFVGTNITGSAGGAISYSQLLAFSNTKTVALEGASSVTGTGITFPATQSASTNANTLDDYEEGTWSPNVGGSATYDGSTYGIYTRVGNVVTVQFRIQITSIGSGSSVQLRGLPFTSAAVAVQSGCVGYFASTAVSTTFLSFYVESNATTMQFTGLSTASTTVGNGLGIFGTSTIVHGSATYRTA